MSLSTEHILVLLALIPDDETYNKLLHAAAAMLVSPESPSELLEIERRDRRGEALADEMRLNLMFYIHNKDCLEADALFYQRQMGDSLAQLTWRESLP